MCSITDPWVAEVRKFILGWYVCVCVHVFLSTALTASKLRMGVEVWTQCTVLSSVGAPSWMIISSSIVTKINIWKKGPKEKLKALNNCFYFQLKSAANPPEKGGGKEAEKSTQCDHIGKITYLVRPPWSC